MLTHLEGEVCNKHAEVVGRDILQYQNKCTFKPF